MHAKSSLSDDDEVMGLKNDVIYEAIGCVFSLCESSLLFSSMALVWAII